MDSCVMVRVLVDAIKCFVTEHNVENTLKSSAVYGLRAIRSVKTQKKGSRQGREDNLPIG